MNKFFIVLAFVFTVPFQLSAQVLPREDSKLNYRLAGFSFPPKENVSKYTVEIAAGRYFTTDSFKKNIIESVPADSNKIIAEVPSFGSDYTWRVVCPGHKPSLDYSPLHHFCTGTTRNVDTNIVRLRILHHAEKYNDAFIFMDDFQALYGMDGHPVWYLPDAADVPGATRQVSDLKLSPQGTITYLAGQPFSAEPYEINFNGAVLWASPQSGLLTDDSVPNYHHEFTRLANGHYMLMRNEYLAWAPPVPGDRNRESGDNGNEAQAQREEQKSRKLSIGTLTEYNDRGDLVWTWNSAGYLMNSDIVNRDCPDGIPFFDLQDNSFYFDEAAGVIYLSFQNISRIIKIKYPEGNVMNAYGAPFKPGGRGESNGLFCGQHSCRRSKSGYLYLYNNNICDGASLPKIIMMQEPGYEQGSNLGKIWEYDCTINGMEHVYDNPDNSAEWLQSTAGGNVMELPGPAFFVSMGSPYSKLFIVGLDKKIVWAALPERWDAAEKKWKQAPQYRASIIAARNDLEQLVWDAESQ